MMAQEDGETEKRQEGRGDVEDDDDDGETIVELEMLTSHQPRLEPMVLPNAIERARLDCADSFNSSSSLSHRDFSVVSPQLVGRGDATFGEMLFPEPMDTAEDIGSGYIPSSDMRMSHEEESSLTSDITNEYLAYCYNMLQFRARQGTE